MMYCRMQHSNRPSREIVTYDHLQSTADRIKNSYYNQKHSSIKQLLRAAPDSRPWQETRIALELINRIELTCGAEPISQPEAANVKNTPFPVS
jgi:hypothetical protein